MAIDFPAAPVNGQQYIFAGKTWEFNGRGWAQLSSGLVIPDDSITNAKLANMAEATIKARVQGGGTGDPQDLGPLAIRAILNVEDGANAYQHPNHTGDVTSVGDGAQTIAANAVTNTKAADMAQATVKGRPAGAGSGDPVDLTPSQILAILNLDYQQKSTATGSAAVLGQFANIATDIAIIIWENYSIGGASSHKIQYSLDGSNWVDFSGQFTNIFGANWTASGAGVVSLHGLKQGRCVANISSAGNGTTPNQGNAFANPASQIIGVRLLRSAGAGDYSAGTARLMTPGAA